MTSLPASSIVLSACVAAAAGLVGSFALMRRMTLAADALSHVALPGIGIAILMKVNPLLGAVATLLGGAVLIWTLEPRTRVATDAIIGVIFSAALAVGALLTTGEELIDALFGMPGAASVTELTLGFAAAMAVIVFVVLARDRLVVSFLSADVARTAGIDVRRLDLLFLLAFALTVALGLRYLGALLVGSLVIIPAATARQLARGLRSMLAIAVMLAVTTILGGTWAAARLHRESGPVIVIVASMCFFGALLVRHGVMRRR